MSHPLLFALLAAVGNAIYVYGQRGAVVPANPFLFVAGAVTVCLVLFVAASLVYRTPEDLIGLIQNFGRSAPSAREAYESLFSPAPVMQRFEANLIRPAQAGDLEGARKARGWRRWDPLLMARPKLRKILRKA